MGGEAMRTTCIAFAVAAFIWAAALLVRWASFGPQPAGYAGMVYGFVVILLLIGLALLWLARNAKGHDGRA